MFQKLWVFVTLLLVLIVFSPGVLPAQDTRPIDAGFSGLKGVTATAVRFCTGGGSGVALATAGTNTTLSAATSYTYVSTIFLPVYMSVTGISVLAGGTAGGADHWEAALAPASGGATVAKSASVVSASSTNAFYDIPFTAPYFAKGPGRWHVEFQSNGTTDKIQTVAAANSWGDVLTQKPASTVYGTFPSLTAPATFTADIGPIVCLYGNM